MQLDLRKIMDAPGSEEQFETELEPERLLFPQITGYNSNPSANGRVYNEAGIIRLEGTITADMQCICDRCGAEFNSIKQTDFDVVLATEESEDNPELFIIEADSIDLDEVLSTCFILDMETKFLCTEDCKGLCSTCGKNLNLGPCSCRKQPDPRFAVLEQLLDK